MCLFVFHAIHANPKINWELGMYHRDGFDHSQILNRKDLTLGQLQHVCSVIFYQLLWVSAWCGVNTRSNSRGMQCCSTSFSTPYCNGSIQLGTMSAQASPKSGKPSQNFKKLLFGLFLGRWVNWLSSFPTFLGIRTARLLLRLRLCLWLRFGFGLAGRLDVPELEQTGGSLGGKLESNSICCCMISMKSC